MIINGLSRQMSTALSASNVNILSKTGRPLSQIRRAVQPHLGRNTHFNQSSIRSHSFYPSRSHQLQSVLKSSGIHASDVRTKDGLFVAAGLATLTLIYSLSGQRTSPAESTESVEAKSVEADSAVAENIGIEGVGAEHAGAGKVEVDKRAALQQMADIPPVDGLPTWSSERVAAQSKATDRFLVTLGHGVYDITDFLEDHPGGSVINVSKGQDLSQFWSSQRQHFKASVLEILENYRVGNLDKPVVFDYGEDPYAKEPPRDLLGKVFNVAPYNAEPDDLILTESGLTPVDDVFVRNHKPMPLLNAKSYEIVVNLGELSHENSPQKTAVNNSARLKLDTLFNDETKIEQRTLVLACGGQRRSDTQSTLGSPWSTANANVEVSGINIKTLLAEQGLDWERVGPHDYLVLEGHDGYKSCIPLVEMPEHAILANKMNGEPLSNDHGYPVRAFFEGYAGHFHIKRLKAMSIVRNAKPESEEHKYHLTKEKDAYKMIVEGAFKGHVDRLPLQSLFAGETPDSIEQGEPTTLFEGMAYSGSGSIAKVEVSLDSTKGPWIEAELNKIERPGQPWVQWSVEMPTETLAVGTHYAYCRAVDGKGESQPEVVEENRRGLGFNGYHRVAFEVEA